MRTISRCLDLFESLSEGEKSLTDIADQIGLPPSTVHRMLATLVERSYVSRIHDRQTYVIGARLLELAHQNEGLAQSLAAIATDLLQEAAASAQETCTLTVRSGWQAIYVAEAEAKRTMRVSTELGKAVPFYATGVGKVMLAYLEESEIAAYLSHAPFPQLTAHTITTEPQISKELRAIRERGFATDKQEHEEGIVCVAAPIFQSDGHVVAAVSISGPSGRLHRDAIPLVGQLAVSTADAVSARLRRASGSGGQVGGR